MGQCPGDDKQMLKTKEHYDLMYQFEKEYKHECLDKENKDMWAKGRIYQNGNVNNLFVAYRSGYALAKSISKL